MGQKMPNMAEKWSQIGGYVGFENRLEQTTMPPDTGAGLRKGRFRVPGPGEMAEGARDPHGGRETPKVPPGSWLNID